MEFFGGWKITFICHIIFKLLELILFCFLAESFLRGFAGTVGDESRKRHQSSTGKIIKYYNIIHAEYNWQL